MKELRTFFDGAQPSQDIGDDTRNDEATARPADTVTNLLVQMVMDEAEDSLRFHIDDVTNEPRHACGMKNERGRSEPSVSRFLFDTRKTSIRQPKVSRICFFIFI